MLSYVLTLEVYNKLLSFAIYRIILKYASGLKKNPIGREGILPMGLRTKPMLKNLFLSSR